VLARFPDLLTVRALPDDRFIGRRSAVCEHADLSGDW